MKGNNQKGTKVVNSNLILNLNIIYIKFGFFQFLFFKIRNQTKKPNKVIY